PGSLEEPEGEDTPCSPYAAAKATTRNYARMFQLLYGMPIVHTRVFMCYGPGQPDWKLIPYLMRCFRGRNPPAVASPDRAVDWIFAGDAAQGLLAAAGIPSWPGRTIDVGSGRLVTIRDIAEKVRAFTNSSVEVDYGAAAPRAHEQTRCADAQATFELTGWRARVSLDDGLKITINANEADG
ncbi:MAG: GDP-mannose 4,6-dehydratase, partial [Betaproteobacteria bacterium]|nr:GDP-mannose 4,6-dehydratase [Betaproteobacteria bacterium]